MKNTKFAKALVSSDRHTRDKTFERLRKWLCSQKTLDHLSMKKVWKALFYAMWHSDGREVQRELATSIAAVMHSLKSQMAILYASVFFWTMRNEWAGIDKHRLDKYCVLARQMQKHMFQYLQRRDWETNVSQNLADRVYRDALFGMDENITAIDLGIKLHVAEAFGEEIRRFDAKEEEKKKKKKKKKRKSKRSEEERGSDEEDKENVEVTDDDEDSDDDDNDNDDEKEAGEAPPQEIIKMLLITFMHGMRHETSFSFLKRCASEVFEVFCPTNVDIRNAPRNKNGWVLNASYIKDLARVAIELGAGNGCPETSREALYELHTDLKKAAVVADKAPSIELKKDQKLTIKVANRIMSEEKYSSEEEEEEEEEKITSGNKKKKMRAEIRVIDDKDGYNQPEKKKQKKNKKKAEKMFAENPFEKVLQEKHALAAAKEAAAKEDGDDDDDDDDDDDKHTALNGHTVAARRLLNFKPKKYQDNGIGDSPSSPDSSRLKRLSWNLKGITRSFPSGAIDTSKGVQNIKTSTPTKGLLKPIHSIGKGSPSVFVKSKYFPGPPASAPQQRRTASMHAPFNEEDSDEDQREDHMILGIKKNNKRETKKKKHKHAHKKNKKNRRLTM